VQRGTIPLITYNGKENKNKFCESVTKSISRNIMTIERQ
jgi:hypothetical protein